MDADQYAYDEEDTAQGPHRGGEVRSHQREGDAEQRDNESAPVLDDDWRRIPAKNAPTRAPKAEARKSEPAWLGLMVRLGSAAMVGSSGGKMKRATKVARNIAVSSTMEPTTARSGWGVGQALAMLTLLVGRRPGRRLSVDVSLGEGGYRTAGEHTALPRA